MSKKYKMALPVLVILFLVSSCISIDTKLTIEEDGSGKVELNYSVSRMVTNLGKLDEEDDFLPLPLTEKDFLATAAMIQGLEVESFKIEENEEGVDINVLLSFDTIEALSQLIALEEEEPSVTLVSEGGRKKFSYIIYRLPEEPINEDSLQMINTFFARDYLAFELIPPDSVLSVNSGEISENGKSARFRIDLTELYNRNTDVIWEVQW
jgi:hypothetical protein